MRFPLVVCSMVLAAMPVVVNAQTPPKEPAETVSALKTVVIEKLNGDRITGVFLGADENVAKIKIAETAVNIALSEVSTIRIVQDKNSQPIAISSDPPKPVIVKARAISMPHPEYPKEAKRLRARGTVKVEISINEFGRVVSARALEGDPIFYPSAEKAAMKGVFEPMTVDGKPAADKTTG